MKYAPPIVAVLVIVFGVWGNVYLLKLHQTKLAELRAQRCTCQHTNIVDTAASSLPPGVVIQKSSDGKYRWKQPYWSSIKEYDTYERAVQAFWESEARVAKDKSRWTNITP